jgi:hypothetical protein
MKAVVVYDSQTGNTRKVAEAIAVKIKADIFPASKSPRDLSAYDIIFIGSPDIRAKPTGRIIDFISGSRIPERAAFFITYGVPVWGAISSWLAFLKMRKASKSRSIGFFRCPGYHHKFKLFKGRPDERDILKAEAFAGKCAGH